MRDAKGMDVVYHGDARWGRAYLTVFGGQAGDTFMSLTQR